MTDFIVRSAQGDDPLKTTAPWATSFNTDTREGEWSVADPELEPNNLGGLAVGDQLTSAVIMCLFTDLRRPKWQTGTDVGGGPRGWAGDYFDIDQAAKERPMGSLLWTLERAPVDDDTAQSVKTEVLDALQTLVDQGRVGLFEVETELDKAKGKLAFSVSAFSETGQNLFENQFPFIG